MSLEHRYSEEGGSRHYQTDWIQRHVTSQKYSS